MSEKSRTAPSFVQWDPLYQLAFKKLLGDFTDAATPLAVFDADGTLWRDDLGEAFFGELIQSKQLPLLSDDPDPMAHYTARVAEDPQAAYGWVVQAMEGVREKWLEEQAAAFVSGFVEKRFFPNMFSLVGELHDAGWDVAIVSASNEWLIREAARCLGLPVTSAIGISTDVVEGVLTGSLVKPVPNGSGKVDAIEARMGRCPALACGNSIHDIPMLAMATEMAVVVEPDGELYSKALEHDWYVVT
jgi:HAD superfamily phosphoserine phosphatase-like hydrolase